MKSLYKTLSGSSILLAIFFGGSLTNPASAQTFLTGNLTDDSFLTSVGSPAQELYGVALDGTNSTFVANGLTFLGSGSAIAQAEVSNVNTGYGLYTGFLTDDGVTPNVQLTTGDTALDSILNEAYYASATSYTLSGLTAGQTYKVLVFAADERFTSGDSSVSLTDGSSASDNQQFVFKGGETPSTPVQAEGGYLLDTFTATELRTPSG